MYIILNNSYYLNSLGTSNFEIPLHIEMQY